MILERLQLQHFRNYAKLDLELSPGSTLLYGANGAGKTNVVEAIFTLATTKSFRARFDREMIGRDLEPGEVPFPFARLQGDATQDGNPIRVEVLIAAAEAGKTDNGSSVRKQFRLNGSPKRASDVVGQVKAVLFSPSDVEIVSGSPSARRRYIDVMLCQVDHSYLRLLQNYTRILQQRNGVLTRISGRSKGTVLEFWDEKLVAEGSEIIRRRLYLMGRLAAFAREKYAEVSGGSEELEVAYVPSIAGLELGNGSEPDGDGIATAFRSGLEAEARRRDDLRMTTVGPHRDDMGLSIDGGSLLAYGSRGQHRTAAMALRMAEAAFILDQTGQEPILLLDEALGELDDDRRDHLLAFVGGYPQVVLTGTSATAFPEAFRRTASLLRVQAGQVESPA
ncbi:MAG TPA: DNA replication/repair protein RecF [Chloroflexota bacterium]|jgi:DNA replication and repair protein RecF|nr:DNA replication/repair protein RecF [Chloroflexota bacterium]